MKNECDVTGIFPRCALFIRGQKMTREACKHWGITEDENRCAYLQGGTCISLKAIRAAIEAHKEPHE